MVLLLLVWLNEITHGGELCSNTNAVNYNKSLTSDGTCGDLCNNTCRCADGYCCSEYGYCGPQPTYVNGTAMYYDYTAHDYYANQSEALDAYCLNNQADYRYVPCPTTFPTLMPSLFPTLIPNVNEYNNISKNKINLNYIYIGVGCFLILCIFISCLITIVYMYKKKKKSKNT